MLPSSNRSFAEPAVPDSITRLNAALGDVYRLASETGEGAMTVYRAQMKRAVDGTDR